MSSISGHNAIYELTQAEFDRVRDGQPLADLDAAQTPEVNELDEAAPEEVPLEPAPEPRRLYPLSEVAADTGFDEETLGRWVRAFERRGQVILYGPPGTGKTFVASKLAQHLAGGGYGLADLVQFHPAYAPI